MVQSASRKRKTTSRSTPASSRRASRKQQQVTPVTNRVEKSVSLVENEVTMTKEMPEGVNEQTLPVEPAKKIEYDPSDETTPIPLGFKMFAKWKYDSKYHPCEVLERKRLSEAKVASTHNYRYYVHFLEFDRRMDDWVDRENMKVESEMGNVDEAERGPHLTIPEATRDGSHGHFSLEDHRAHEEATKVKNVHWIELGKFEMETWYFSPFPAELRSYEKLLFCEFCLSFFPHRVELDRHKRRCKIRHPPGDEIYRSVEQNCVLSVFEIDGSREVIYCQNLCLIAKLFLDHKTLQYDTEAFLFYVVTEVDEYGCQIAGFFSKEKEPEQMNNLACILTLPCHQRKGYGKFLISLSYELSKIEGRPGSPEKPLSDLGRVSYESYWSQVLLRELQLHGPDAPPISIEDLSQKTGILASDVKETLERMNIIRYEHGEHVFHLSEALFKTYLTPKPIDPSRVHVGVCDPLKLHFTPYILTKGRRVIRA